MPPDAPAGAKTGACYVCIPALTDRDYAEHSRQTSYRDDTRWGPHIFRYRAVMRAM